MIFSRSATVAIAVATIMAPSACSQRAGTLPSTVASQVAPLTSPPECKGQQDAKQYATLTGPLEAKGGAFCIPAYGGYGGTLEYPNASFNGTVDLTLTTSVKNYNHQSKLGKGTPIFYIQFAISGAVSFGSKIKSGGGLTGGGIVNGQPYTLYGQAKAFGQKISLGSCYTTATKGPYGGVIGEIGSLVKNRSVPFAASGVIEIYSGKQTAKRC